MLSAWEKVLAAVLLVLVPPIAFFTLFGGYFYITDIRDGTDIAYQSSDGAWQDSEVHFKGRHFDSVVASFEDYRRDCNAPTAQLERLTPRPPAWSPESWFNDYDDPQWRVPMAKHIHPNANTMASFECRSSASEAAALAESE